MQSTDPCWYRQHFNEDYRTLYAARNDEEAEAQAAFAAERLDISPRDTLLDLCCGHGRHLEAFARRNIKATGVDLSLPLLETALSRKAGPLIRADMRKLPFADGGFTVLVNFFTSLGYFESEEENLAAIEEMARVLQPGGRFLIDLINPLDAASPVPRSLREEGRFEIREERWFDDETLRVKKRIELLDTGSGERRDYRESVRIYGEDELLSILAPRGLKVDELRGDFTGAPFQAGSPRMILLGVRS